MKTAHLSDLFSKLFFNFPRAIEKNSGKRIDENNIAIQLVISNVQSIFKPRTHCVGKCCCGREEAIAGLSSYYRSRFLIFTVAKPDVYRGTFRSRGLHQMYTGRFGPNQGYLPLSVTQIYHWSNRIVHSQHLKNGPIWVRGVYFKGAYRYRFRPNKGISPLSVTQIYHRRIRIAHSPYLKNGPFWVLAPTDPGYRGT